MPLIIETYDNPYTKIASLLFPERQFIHVQEPITEPKEELYCYCREECDPVEKIRFCFNRIYFIEKGKIVSINKTAQITKLYDLVTGKLILLNQKTEEIESIDKKEFLPQLHAQTGDIVIFPEEDDEI